MQQFVKHEQTVQTIFSLFFGHHPRTAPSADDRVCGFPPSFLLSCPISSEFLRNISSNFIEFIIEFSGHRENSAFFVCRMRANSLFLSATIGGKHNCCPHFVAGLWALANSITPIEVLYSALPGTSASVHINLMFVSTALFCVSKFVRSFQFQLRHNAKIKKQFCVDVCGASEKEAFLRLQLVFAGVSEWF